MQEEEPEDEQQATPRPDQTESPLGEGIEEFLTAGLIDPEVEQRLGDPETKVGVNPLPLPDVPEPIDVDDVSANPLPLPDVPEPIELGMDPDPILRAEEMSTNPLLMPGPENDPLPLPDPAMEEGFGDIGDLPIPIPNEADLIGGNLAEGLEEEPFEELLD
jgi:hypothetical protein